LDWDSRRIGDGMGQRAVRPTDAVGGTGDSAPVVVWVQNKGDCGARPTPAAGRRSASWPRSAAAKKK
jgi:hypothetical protein